MWVQIPLPAPMNETEKNQKIEAFKKKLLLTSKKEIIDLLVEKIKELAELQDLYRTSFEKEVERERQHQAHLDKICAAAQDNAKILERIHKLLDNAGQLYPDMSLDSCVQGLLVDLEFLRERLAEAKKSESKS